MKRDISHVLQLSSEERALRDEQIRKEMAELNYWQDYPKELLAEIRKTDPSYRQCMYS
jgi:hypothetical protein